MLKISTNLTLPPDFVTRTQAILAVKGAGKTYTGMKQTEQMLSAGDQVVALDPTGVWWGLRSSADGKRAGFPIIVMGGDHGDVPLEPSAGELVAEFVVESRQPVVLDLSAFETGAAQNRFVTAFAEKLYRLKAHNRSPIHLMLDEADSFAPQRPMPGEARMLGAFEAIVRRGRSRGMGMTMLTQRPAVLNKNVLTQVDLLTCLRISSPQDQKAVKAWIEAHGTAEQQKEMMASLASLPNGTAWVWSPSWLNIFKQVKIAPRTTFDSSRTPETGSQDVQPRKLAPVDLDSLSAQIRQTVESAKANDPKELRRQLTEAQKKISTLEAKPTEAPVVKTEYVEVPVHIISPELGAQLMDRLASAEESMNEVRYAIASVTQAATEEPKKPLEWKTVEIPAKRVFLNDRPAKPTAAQRTDTPIKAGARRLLETLARRHPMKVTIAQLGTLAKFKITGGTFKTYYGTLKREGLIEETGGEIAITKSGMEFVGHTPLDPQTPEQVIEMWKESLKRGERDMLDILVGLYPDSASTHDLAHDLGMTASGGTFKTYLGNLRRNGLVEVENGEVSASSNLFE